MAHRTYGDELGGARVKAAQVMVAAPALTQLIEMVWAFDQLKDVGELADLIASLRLFRCP